MDLLLPNTISKGIPSTFLVTCTAGLLDCESMEAIKVYKLHLHLICLSVRTPYSEYLFAVQSNLLTISVKQLPS